MEKLSSQKTINAQLKKDPFIKLWKSNYHQNLKNKEFDKSQRYGIEFLSKRVLKEKLTPDCLLVNPGPSLEKNIKNLKNFYDNKKGIILTSDVCMFRLIEEGIIPDIVCTVDPSNNILRFWEGYEDYTKDIILIASTACSPESIKLWKGPIVFFNQRDAYPFRNEFFKKLTKKTSKYGSFLNLGFVGATLCQASIALNAKNIFLIGWDFSSDVKGNMYCNGFLHKRIYTDIAPDSIDKDIKLNTEKYNSIKELLLSNWDKGITAFKKQLQKDHLNELKEIKFINSETEEVLFTNPQYDLYKKIFLKTILPAFTNQTVVNCTEGGLLTEINSSPLSNISPISMKERVKSILFH